MVLLPHKLADWKLVEPRTSFDQDTAEEGRQARLDIQAEDKVEPRQIWSPLFLKLLKAIIKIILYFIICLQFII